MRVKKAEYVRDYKIKIVFSDGAIKIVDFKPFLKDAKNLFIPLLDIEYFKNFSVDDTTISWPNGGQLRIRIIKHVKDFISLILSLSLAFLG
jgi:hypothetical protein